MTTHLTEERLRQIYEEKIKPKFFENISVSENKTAIFLGGQPGAGKSKVNDLSIKSLTTQNAVVIDTDLLRPHHPLHGEIPESLVYDLDKDSSFKWGEMLLKDAIKEGKNVVFDGTLGGSIDQTLEKMSELKDNNYHVKVNVLATNDSVSKIGVTWRYEHQMEKFGQGRHVDIDYHDKVYHCIPENINHLINSKKVDELNIYSRNHQTKEIFVKAGHTYDAKTLQNNPMKPIRDFIEERTRPFTKKEISALESWAKATSDLLQKRGQDIGEFRGYIKTNDPNATDLLRTQIETIVQATKKSINQNQTTMETKVTPEDSTKKKIETLKGRLGSDIEFANVTTKEKGEIKQVATFSLADNSKGKETVWHNAHMWEDKFPKNLNDIKKGDLVELKGYNKSFETKEGKTKTELEVTEVLSHQAKKSVADVVKEKERITLKGNLGQDPVIENVKDKHTVANFSIAVKQEGSKEPKWQQVSVWNKDIEKNKIKELKKGDFVELKGYLGNEYQNSKQETKQNLNLEECKVLAQAHKNDLGQERNGGMKM